MRRWRCGGPSSAAPPSGAGWSTPTATAAGANTQTRVDFFLEYDRGSEPLGRLAAKLPGYHALAQASEIATPLLLWLPTPAREAATRQALAASSLPVATATPHPDHTPAGPLWLPLHTSGPRRRLAQLASPW